MHPIKDLPEKRKSRKQQSLHALAGCLPGVYPVALRLKIVLFLDNVTAFIFLLQLLLVLKSLMARDEKVVEIWWSAKRPGRSGYFK